MNFSGKDHAILRLSIALVNSVLLLDLKQTIQECWTVTPVKTLGAGLRYLSCTPMFMCVVALLQA